MELRVATFNVLADAYVPYGDYKNVNADLLEPGARTHQLVNVIEGLEADVIGLQEVEKPLVDALSETGNWQTLWSPRNLNKADGCLTLVKPGLDVDSFESYAYSDTSGHIMQILHIGRVAFANTHIKWWSPVDNKKHVGAAQMAELIDKIGTQEQAVILADCNDRPKGPVRPLVKNANFVNIFSDMPTAFVNGQVAAIDLLAVRGIVSTRVAQKYDVETIPNAELPSDHVPLVADLNI